MTRDERIEGIARALVELWRRGQLPGADALLEAMDSALAPAPTPSPATTCKCGRYSLAPITVLSHLDPYDRKHTANECPIPAPSKEPAP